MWRSRIFRRREGEEEEEERRYKHSLHQLKARAVGQSPTSLAAWALK